MPEDIVEPMFDLLDELRWHKTVTEDDDTNLYGRVIDEITRLRSALKEREEALDDCLATMAAVRATSVSPDDWANSAQHLHDICGESMSKARASLNREKE